MDNVEKEEDLKSEQTEFFGGIVQSYEPELVLASQATGQNSGRPSSKSFERISSGSRSLDSVVDFYPGAGLPKLPDWRRNHTSTATGVCQALIDVIRAFMVSAAWRPFISPRFRDVVGPVVAKWDSTTIWEIPLRTWVSDLFRDRSKQIFGFDLPPCGARREIGELFLWTSDELSGQVEQLECGGDGPAPKLVRG